MNPRDWEQTPACAGMSHLFFNLGGGNYVATAGWVRHAKQLCAQCPVLSECRQWNDTVEGNADLARLDGIYAGETPSERVNRRAGLRPRVAEPRTHCANGHPWSDENTYVNTQGWRQCVECRRESGRRYRRRHRQGVAA